MPFLNLGFGAIKGLGVKVEGRGSAVDEHRLYTVFASSAGLNTMEVGNGTMKKTSAAIPWISQDL